MIEQVSIREFLHYRTLQQVRSPVHPQSRCKSLQRSSGKRYVRWQYLTNGDLEGLAHPVFFSIEAMAHPRCVGWGEIGLDYHYDNSPRDIQQRVFVRQLRQAVKLAKPLTIHTREADEDTLRILKEEVPKDHRVSHSFLSLPSNSALISERKIHIHCFTDTPEFAKQMLDHFQNLYIGVTGAFLLLLIVGPFPLLK